MGVKVFLSSLEPAKLDWEARSSTLTNSTLKQHNKGTVDKALSGVFPYTYPIIIFDVDISSFLNKVFHYFPTDLFSC